MLRRGLFQTIAGQGMQRHVPGAFRRVWRRSFAVAQTEKGAQGDARRDATSEARTSEGTCDVFQPDGGRKRASPIPMPGGGLYQAKSGRAQQPNVPEALHDLPPGYQLQRWL